MRKLLYTLLLCMLAGTGFAQTAKNINLLGHLPFNDQLADVMGYVAPGGTEYAIVGHENGVAIVSLANPANPTTVQDLPGINTIWREIDVYQNYAYIVNEGGDGLRIVNLSTLPGNVAYKDTVINGMNTGHTVYITGNRMYVYGADIDNGGVSIFSLTDPWRPVHIGSYTNRYVHDAYVRNNIAYLSEVYDGFMEMVDLTNPTNPVVLGSVITPSQFTHNTWLNDAGTVCFTTDEVDAAWIAAYDITNPNNIVEIDRAKSSNAASNGQSIPHNVKVLNDFIVTAYYKDGVNIMDCDRPHNLIEVGYYDTNPASGGGFDGVWGLDCYLPSGNIIAADMSEGLYILGPTYVRGCYLEGTVTDVTNGNPIVNANVVINSTSANDATDGNGDYATGLADGGTYTVTYSAFGYQDSTITVTLVNGQLELQNIALTPLARISVLVNVVEAGSSNPIPNAKVLFEEVNGYASLPYSSNASGQVTDPNFIAASYNVLAGKWGYVTRSITHTFSPQQTVLTIELTKGYHDEFVLDLGWNATGSSSTGVWERGEPVGTYDNFGTIFNPEQDMTGDIGDQCYVTGNGGGATGDDDVDGGNSILTSPIMDLSTYTEPVVSYYRWFANGGGFGGNPNDTLRIEISNGMSTVVLKRVFGSNHNVWQRDTFVVSNFISPTANMRMRFIAVDENPGHVVEAGVDRFSVIDLAPTAITPEKDLNAAALTVAPNPLQGVATVAYDLGTPGRVAGARFEVHDLAGRVVYARELTEAAGQFQLDVEIPAGMYMGSIRVDGQIVRSLRIVK